MLLFYTLLKVERREKFWFYSYWSSVHPHKKTNGLHINITATEILMSNVLQSGAYNSSWHFTIVSFPVVNQCGFGFVAICLLLFGFFFRAFYLCHFFFSCFTAMFRNSRRWLPSPSPPPWFFSVLSGKVTFSIHKDECFQRILTALTMNPQNYSRQR